MTKLGIAGLLTALFAASAVADSLEHSGTLSGIVLDVDQRPVAGASVFLDDYDYNHGVFHPVATTVSETDGSFHLSTAGPAFHRERFKDVRIVADGFAPGTIPGSTFSIIPDADVALGKVHISRGQVLSGQVFDTDGKPAAGAMVECDARCYFAAHGGDPITPLYHLTTDANGRFSTPPLPVSYAGFTVIVPGRLRPWVCVPVGPESRAELAPIHLQPCDPIVGQLRDEKGNPVPHASVSASGMEFGGSWLGYDESQTDDQGRFKIEGLRRRIGLQIYAADHISIYWQLRGEPNGLYWVDCLHGWSGDPKELIGPVTELHIPMKSLAWISGRALDADTGKPVRLSQVLLCNFTRKVSGEVVLNGCQSPEFRQEADGSFRLPYGIAQEYHLTLSADGYQDAEAFTPAVQTLQPISGIVARLRKLSGSANSQIVRQTLNGTITRDGKPVKAGIIALGQLASIEDKPNVKIFRGRTVLGQGKAVATAEVHDGKYTLNVPYQDDDWWIRVEEPDQAITQLLKVSVKLNEQRKLDIAMVAGGGISGHVGGIPDRWKRDTWVVAVARSGLRFGAQVQADSSFAFDKLPPGEYGVKAGHDAFMDAECPQNLGDQDPAFGSPSDPWKRAIMVQVESGKTTANIVVAMPEK